MATDIRRDTCSFCGRKGRAMVYKSEMFQEADIDPFEDTAVCLPCAELTVKTLIHLVDFT